MAYVKRPNGFRAVRMRGKTEIVYCVERFGHMSGGMREDSQRVDVYGPDGSKQGMSASAFNTTHASEYSPMPDAVRALFAGKPSFAEWWDARKK